MPESAFNCPSCGASLQVKHRFSKVVVCEYCSQTSYITPKGLDPAGESAELVDFESILSIGARGAIHNQNFTVLGRVRYEYDGGFWDEWFCLREDQSQFWLQEDDGTFTRFEKAKLLSPLPPYDEIGVGASLPINDGQFFVMEKCEAKVRGAGGELPFSLPPETPVKSIDGNMSGKQASVEFFPDEICFSIGEDIQRSAIAITK